ncbi:hypothetical protein DEA8626_00119 [Defluviimonas aquaemixtae]|uniref:Glycosyltransferase RgtA/B/C/D-like domain-containing protein n=1 Tax=Albidovulum aquaemixtae TaxID=1542388 RepID=A0A2R8B1V7_9RHOB|nr:hypothetical protein [Defluviimonas aquaemixtae]SPH16609.1 hypothetical protein DEA8626_00119 [Defluviimonas aquaemixtae]
MTDAADPMDENAAGAALGRGKATIVFLGIVLGYLLTAPTNHSLSVDTYYYALIITHDPIIDVENPRLFLWLAAMKGLYRLASAVLTDIDLFRLIGVVNAVLASLAVMLLARLLVRDFSLARRSAWLTAGLFASCYGFWRYATEIEVYASAVLLSLLLVHAAFRLVRNAPARSFGSVLGLAVLGGIGTLTYQPIGIVAGLVVPVFLLLSGRIRYLAQYSAIAGAMVIGGFGLAAHLGTEEEAAHAVSFVLQADHVAPKLPSPMSLAKMVYAVSHDLLSTNWMFAIESLRERFRLTEGFFLHQEHRFVAENAGPQVWVALATLPAAAVLGLVIIGTAWRTKPRQAIDAREAAVIVWLVAHGAMMLTLSPLGFEGWIPGLVPLAVLSGKRLIAPCVAADRSAVVAALLAVFIVHNGIVGIGTQMREAGDYLHTRGTALIERVRPGDLIVMAAHWNLERYLRFNNAPRAIIVEKEGVNAVRRAIEETLDRGGRVLILDDVAAPTRLSRGRRVLVPDLVALTNDYLGNAERFATGQAGWAYEVRREEDKE